MSSAAVVVFEVGGEDTLQMPLAENDDMIQTLSANRSDHAFAVGILPGRARRNRDLVNAQTLDPCSEMVSIRSVPIPDQVAWRFVERKRLDDLLSRPLRSRMQGDIEVHDPATIVRRTMKQ